MSAPNKSNLTVVRDEQGNLRIIADATFPTVQVLILSDADAAGLVHQLTRKLRCADCGMAGEYTGHITCQRGRR